MKLHFLFKPMEVPSSSWPWPSCGGNAKTLSFRAENNMSKTMNPTYIDSSAVESRLTDEDSSDSGSISTEIDEHSESIETMIRSLRSERLFFEAEETSSIVKEAKKNVVPLIEESLVMAMDSMDPFLDFKRSMEEMVEALGLKDWECLQELLSWYLKVNLKSNHGYIVGAFVDLLVGLSFDDFSSSSSSFSSSSSSCCDVDGDGDPSLSTTNITQSPTSALSFSSSTSYISPCLSSSSEARDQDADEKAVIKASISHV